MRTRSHTCRPPSPAFPASRDLTYTQTHSRRCHLRLAPWSKSSTCKYISLAPSVDPAHCCLTDCAMRTQQEGVRSSCFPCGVCCKVCLHAGFLTGLCFTNVLLTNYTHTAACMPHTYSSHSLYAPHIQQPPASMPHTYSSRLYAPHIQQS